MVKSKFISIIVLVGLIGILIGAEPTDIETHEIYFYYFYFILIALIIHIVERNNNNWFSIDIIFLVGFLVVHLQWPIMLWVSDVTPRFFSRAYANTQYIAYGTWLSAIGVVSWVFGFILITSKPISKATFFIKYKKLLIFTLIVYILFLVFSGEDYLRGNVYKGLSKSANASGLGRYFQVFFSISIIVLTAVIFSNKEYFNGKYYIKILGLNKLYLFIVTSALLLFLTNGDRGGAIQIVISFFILFGAFVRPINFKELIVVAVIGAFVLTIVGFGRSSKENKNILMAGVDRFRVESAYDISIELANSSRTLYSAIAYIENNDYFYGKLWLGDIFSIFPLGKNIFLTISEEKYYNVDSAELITYLAYGENAHSGEGTSLIADIYLNFGKYGVIFFMFISGLWIKKMMNELNKKRNLFWIVSAAIFASFSLYLCRGTFLFSAKPMIWGVIIFYLFTRNINRRRVD